MAHFAKIEDGFVTQVLVIEQDVINTGLFGNPKSWVQTSYNTQAGVHRLGGTPFRKNYAGIGFTYDEQRDAFIPPRPFNSWVLNEDTCNWQAPIPYPTDVGTEDAPIYYRWDEAIANWVVEDRITPVVKL